MNEQVHLPKNQYNRIPSSNVDWSRISNRENYFQGANHYFPIIKYSRYVLFNN